MNYGTQSRAKIDLRNFYGRSTCSRRRLSVLDKLPWYRAKRVDDILCLKYLSAYACCVYLLAYYWDFRFLFSHALVGVPESSRSGIMSTAKLRPLKREIVAIC